MALLLAAAGCSDRDKPAPFGLGSVEPERSEEEITTVIVSPPDLDTYAEIVVGAGESATLYVGAFGPREMRSLLRVGSLPSGRTVRSASLRLATTGLAGDSIPATVGAHRVRTDWSESSADAANLPAFDGDPLATAVSAPGETTFVIALPETLVQTWVNAPDANFGLLLAGLGEGTLRKFASRQATSGGPALLLASDPGDGSTVFDTLAADRDTYVARPDTAADEAAAARLPAGTENGFARRAAFQFTIPSEIGADATVNFAALEAVIDRAASRLAGTSLEVSVHEIVSAVDTTAVVFRTEPEAVRTIDAEAETLAVPVTGLVARTRLAGGRTVKLLLRARVEVADTDFLSFVSTEGAAADSLRPRLRLVVSRPRAQEGAP